MPSIYGGSSSGRDYAPHMWVLRSGGDRSRDDDYTFFGNASTYYRDPDTGGEYHLGVTALGEVVAQVTSDNYQTLSGIDPAEVPEGAKGRLIKEGLRQIGTLSGNQVLAACGINLPEGMEPLHFEKLFNGSLEEKAAELAREKEWEVVAAEIRQTLGTD